MDLYLEVGIEIIGSLIGVAIGLALLGGIVYWQYREFKTWPHSNKTYWIFKLGAPLGFVVFVFISGAIASLVEGMEALGVFYVGIFAALGLSPLFVAGLGPVLGVDFKDSIRVTVSVVVAALGIAFGGSMAVNSGAGLFYIDMDYEKRMRAYQEAEKNPAPAGDIVRFLDQQLLMMPDGKRLVSLALEVAPGWHVYRLRLKTPALDGRREKFEMSNSYCFDDNVLHISTVVDKTESVDFSLLWEPDGVEGDFIEYARRIEFPAHQFDDYFMIYAHEGEYELSVPVPAHQLSFVTNGQITRFSDLFPVVKKTGAPRRPEDNRCTTNTFKVPVYDYASLSMYSDELRQYLPFRLRTKEMAPEFR